MASQLLKKSSADLKCAQRAWKVTLVGEGADDAGGVFDESIAQMCEVQNQLLLLPYTGLILRRNNFAYFAFGSNSQTFLHKIYSIHVHKYEGVAVHN